MHSQYTQRPCSESLLAFTSSSHNDGEMNFDCQFESPSVISIFFLFFKSLMAALLFKAEATKGLDREHIFILSRKMAANVRAQVARSTVQAGGTKSL